MRKLLADAREVPRVYWFIGAVLLVALYSASAADVPQLLPGSLMFTPYPRLIWTAATLVLSIGPLLAVLRPWWGLVLAVLCVASVLAGVLLFTALAGLAGVSLVGWWRSRVVPVVAALAAVAASTGVILAGGVLVFPGDATGLGGDALRWHWDSAGQAAQYVAAYAVPLLLVPVVGWLVRRSAVRSASGRMAIARAQEVEEQSAVTAERARLARDLHDVVAHHVSLIAVRAETAPYTHPSLGEEARGVLGEIAGDARLALDELRGVLGILNRADDGAAARAPQPGLSDLPALVERTRSAGVAVDLEGDTRAGVSPGVGYVACRIVQEGLTNARRHAAGAAVEVRLDTSQGMLVVVVGNPVTGATTSGPGHGLSGMRERVEAAGGHLDAGERDGRFVVRASLPRREP